MRGGVGTAFLDRSVPDLPPLQPSQCWWHVGLPGSRFPSAGLRWPGMEPCDPGVQLRSKTLGSLIEENRVEVL